MAFLRPADFADRIGVSTRTLARLVKTGKIKPATITEGGHHRYTEAQAAEWLEQMAKRNQPPPPKEPSLTHRGRGLSATQWVREQSRKRQWRQNAAKAKAP